MELTHAVVVITGGAGGVGSRVGQAFAREGARVVVADRGRQADAERLASELKGVGAPDSLAIDADLVQAPSIAVMVEQVVAAFGRLDVLVNAAAINQFVPFADLDSLTEELWERLIRSVLTGPFLCSKAVAPLMKRQGNGRIVNVTSVAGFAPLGSSIAYAVAKSGLAHLTRCLAVALAPGARRQMKAIASSSWPGRSARTTSLVLVLNASSCRPSGVRQSQPRPLSLVRVSNGVSPRNAAKERDQTSSSTASADSPRRSRRWATSVRVNVLLPELDGPPTR